MFEYEATLDRLIDGDTIDVLIDLGFDIHIKKRVRIFGINTPESRTRDLEEKKRGLAAKARLKELIKENGNKFQLTSHGVGKFGRCLGEIELSVGNAGDILVSEGHAYPYFGGNKEEAKAKAAEILAESKAAVEFARVRPEKDL